MQGQRGQDFETAARGRHSFRFLGPRPNDRLSHPVKEAAYRAAIHLNPQRGVERLAHFLQAALGIALMRAPQERLRLGGEFATISLTPPVQETGEALGRQAGLVTKILWPTKGHRVSAEKLVHGQIGSSDLFYHRCDLLGSAFPAGRGPVHPPQHSLNMAIWPACSAVFVRSWGIKRYNWTMLFRGEDSSSSWLLIISSTDSFLRARESRSYVELRSGPVSANCNSPKYQTIVMYYSMDETPRPFFYVPLRQYFTIEPDIQIRATQPLPTIQTALIREVRALDPDLTLYEMITLQEQVNRSTSHELVAVALVALFGGLALLLASIGLYGVMSYSVSQTTRELGLRMALGASASNVLRLVLSRGLLLTTTGMVIGIALALFLTRLLGNLLYQVSPRDPLAFVVAFAVMTLASTGACFLPAWRA